MKYLGIDVGTKRTGMAYADSEDDVVFSLETFPHSSQEELLCRIKEIYIERSIDELVLGLPILPSGVEGSQALFVQTLSQSLHEANIPHSLLDERYTTKRSANFDPDAASACEILHVKLSMK